MRLKLNCETCIQMEYVCSECPLMNITGEACKYYIPKNPLLRKFVSRKHYLNLWLNILADLIYQLVIPVGIVHVFLILLTGQPSYLVDIFISGIVFLSIWYDYRA